MVIKEDYSLVNNVLRLKGKRIIFFTKYAKNAASTRYRVIQYIPFLEALNAKCEVSPLLGEIYLNSRFKSGKIQYLEILKGFLRRIWVLINVKKDDLAVIYCELFPYFPAVLEKYLQIRGVCYVVDFDDAIFHIYDQHRCWITRFILGNKMRSVIAGASQVIAGNYYLAQYAKIINQHVHIIPTVVDINLYQEKKYTDSDEDKFTVGWIGSPSTAGYLNAVAGILKEFSRNYDVRIIFIGSGPIGMPNLKLDIREWSEDTVIENLLDFDVGIMPLPDTPWARGKCGFKLIQYMACCLPVIASAVGTNNEIVDNNKNGFLVKSDKEWYQALVALYDDKNLRKRMGSAGLSKVIRQYSMQSTASDFAKILASAIGRRIR